ncbi:MAG TPA: SurA N-terminal domain-containing protein [Anaerolineae bacterium]
MTLLIACSDNLLPAAAPPAESGEATPATLTNTSEVAPVVTAEPPTATAVPPTPTPSEPLAALVNDQPIFLATYEKELARYEQAQTELGLASDANYHTLVLDALIERVLIAQAAAEQDITITPEMVAEKLTELREAAGGEENFVAWLEANQFTEEEFRQELATEMLTEQVVAAVTADVPVAVEQVRARYIQVDDAALAPSLLEQVRSGADFALLAQQHSLDRVTAENGGDLGFFARGSLLVPEVETAAFALTEPGEVGDVIAVTNADGQTTYYLVQLIERDPQRTLTADLRYTLLQERFESWLDELWQEADIVRFVDTGA